MRIKVLQISSEVNVGSVGKIAEQIGRCILENDWESYIAYGREIGESKSEIFRIGSDLDVLKHVLYTRVTDKHGFASKKATQRLIKKIENLKPNIIQLHHLHGYFINIEILFNFLATVNIPIVWTFHDCWSFTGHCAMYEQINCEKWKTACEKCPQINAYPKSWKTDRSIKNFRDKKKLFTSPKNMIIVSVSDWIENQVKDSFLKDIPTKVIKNGIDLDVFKFTESTLKEDLKLNGKKIILGVAHIWDERKGLNSFLELAKKIDSDYQIILIGLNKYQIDNLPTNITGILKMKNQKLLAQYYSMADVFVNTTESEALGLTNIEALACGTPIITFKTGGSVECVFENTGFVVEKGDIDDIINKINFLLVKDKIYYQIACRKVVDNNFNATNQNNRYIKLYEELLNKLS